MSLSTQDMDSRLEEASRLGDLGLLNSLMDEDPLVLEKAAIGSLKETPLHIASLVGNTEFAKRIIELKPCFAYDRNQEGLIPLHIASALGNQELVSLLLERKPCELCLIRDSRGRTPLHHAAINGHISIIDTLLSKCSKALVVETFRGETALHLALKNEKPNAFQALAKRIEDFTEFKIKYCQSIHQLAIETNQSQVLSYLPEAKPVASSVTPMQNPSRDSRVLFDPQIKQVVASLIATVTFQAVANPPPSIWKQGTELQYNRCFLIWNEGIMRACPGFFYLLFICSNTIGFYFSVLVLVAFRQGPFSDKLLRISLMSLPSTYATLLLAMSPDMRTMVISGIGLCFLVYVARMVRIKTQGRTKPTTTRRRPESWI